MACEDFLHQMVPDLSCWLTPLNRFSLYLSSWAAGEGYKLYSSLRSEWQLWVLSDTELFQHIARFNSGKAWIKLCLYLYIIFSLMTKRFKKFSNIQNIDRERQFIVSLKFYRLSCLTTLWTQLAYRFNWRTARPFPPTSAGGCDEPTSRCRTLPSLWTVGQD